MRRSARSNLEDSNEIECPHCGQTADMLLTRCPACGRSFFPDEDEPASRVNPVRSRSEGLVVRMVAFILIGILLSGGLSLLFGPGWVWLTVVGAVLAGLIGWFSDSARER